LRHETHTHMRRSEIFEAARNFFGQGDGGLGMKLSSEQGCQIAFFGDGLVWITVWPARLDDKQVRVDVDVSDRDEEARTFIEKVLKAPHKPPPGNPPAES
jgi:hypothetical protein